MAKPPQNQKDESSQIEDYCWLIRISALEKLNPNDISGGKLWKTESG